MEQPPPKGALPLDWDVEQHWHVELSETDRHILKQIAHEERKAKRRFEMVAKRHSNAFLLSGPAGWGKSHLGKEVFHDVGMPFFEVNSRVTPIMFFRLLWGTRHGDKALFLDDIEDLLRHPHGVDLVKQAFPRQLGPRRVNWWTSAAPMIVLDPDDLTEEEMERFRDPHTGKVPKRARVHWLDYRGYGACIVNMDVRQEAAANKKLRLESLLDCMFNQEIRLRSPRQRMLRIARVVAEEGIRPAKDGFHFESEGRVIWGWAFLREPQVAVTGKWWLAWGIRFPNSPWWTDAQPSLPRTAHVFLILGADDKPRVPIKALKAPLLQGWASTEDGARGAALIYARPLHELIVTSDDLTNSLIEWLQQRITSIKPFLTVLAEAASGAPPVST